MQQTLRLGRREQLELVGGIGARGLHVPLLGRAPGSVGRRPLFARVRRSDERGCSGQGGVTTPPKRPSEFYDEKLPVAGLFSAPRETRTPTRETPDKALNLVKRVAHSVLSAFQWAFQSMIMHDLDGSTPGFVTTGVTTACDFGVTHPRRR
jgi:hypothetical protein